MPENLQPESLTTWMRDIERRLSAVERPSRLSTVQYTAVSQPNVAVNVTSGTFTTVWEYSLSAVVADSVKLTSVVITPAATTVELRLTSNLSGAPVTDVATVGAGLQRQVTFDWQPPGMEIGMTGVLIQLQARRASGAGTVFVYQPLVAMQWPAFERNASSTGNPVVF